MHTIRKGEPRDIAAIAVIYDRILDREERGGASTGWIRGVYPTADTARAALEAGELFVMEREGRVVVAGRINHEQCPQYAAVPWTEPETPDEQVLVLHTLVSDPLVAGHGCGTEFVAFYEQYAREHGCTWLRIDTNARNVSARRLYARLGYREVDIVPGKFNGIPDVQLVCMEKRRRNIPSEDPAKRGCAAARGRLFFLFGISLDSYGYVLCITRIL